MKLWAWFITSSQSPLTRVRGYSRWILGIMASNWKKQAILSAPFFTDIHTDHRVIVIHLYLLMPLLSKRKLVLTAQVACKLLIRLSVGFATGCGSKTASSSIMDMGGVNRAYRDRWRWLNGQQTVSQRPGHRTAINRSKAQRITYSIHTRIWSDSDLRCHEQTGKWRTDGSLSDRHKVPPPKQTTEPVESLDKQAHPWKMTHFQPVNVTCHKLSVAKHHVIKQTGEETHTDLLLLR